MRRIRAWIKRFFGFSKTETNGFLFLLPLIALCLFSEPAYRWWRSDETPDFSRQSKTLDSLIAGLRWTPSDSINVINPALKLIHTFFDPNKVSFNTLVVNGLSPSMSRRIIRYREKGGIFKKKEDLLKIYGMDTALFRGISPWVKIELTFKNEKTKLSAKKSFLRKDTLDINTADSIQLTTVYGIGPALSHRIKLFRERLGGFISMDQLHEVYGLDSAVVQNLKVKFKVFRESPIKKLNLNTASLDELSRHPYIRKKIAQAIITFRLNHTFESVESVRQIKSIDSASVRKFLPYLTVN